MTAQDMILLVKDGWSQADFVRVGPPLDEKTTVGSVCVYGEGGAERK